MSNYFLEHKSLTKLNFELLLPNTSKGHIQGDEADKDSLWTLYSKTERKISKTETKILTHASGFSEEQSFEKSDDEERNQPTTESKFRESWQKKRPTKLDRNKKVTEKHTCHLPQRK